MKLQNLGLGIREAIWWSIFLTCSLHCFTNFLFTICKWVKERPLNTHGFTNSQFQICMEFKRFSSKSKKHCLFSCFPSDSWKRLEILEMEIHKTMLWRTRLTCSHHCFTIAQIYKFSFCNLQMVKRKTSEYPTFDTEWGIAHPCFHKLSIPSRERPLMTSHIRVGRGGPR